MILIKTKRVLENRSDLKFDTYFYMRQFLAPVQELSTLQKCICHRYPNFIEGFLVSDTFSSK